MRMQRLGRRLGFRRRSKRTLAGHIGQEEPRRAHDLLAQCRVYVLRLAVLPATWLGNAIAVVIVLMLMTTISALTRDRLPLWAMFIGNAAFAGAYNGYFNTTPVTQPVTAPANGAG